MRKTVFALTMIASGALLSAGISATARPKTPCPDAYCDEIELNIRKKTGLLRQSHSNASGRRHKAELARLRDLKRKRCR